MSGIAERLAGVVAAKKLRGCPCAEYRTCCARCMADALLPVVEREIAAARGEALWEAADATLEAPWRLTGKAVADWLRDRAALSPDPDRGEVRTHNHPASKQCRNDCPSGHPSTWAVGDKHRFQAEDET